MRLRSCTVAFTKVCCLLSQVEAFLYTSGYSVREVVEKYVDNQARAVLSGSGDDDESSEEEGMDPMPAEPPAPCRPALTTLQPPVPSAAPYVPAMHWLILADLCCAYPVVMMMMMMMTT